MKKKPKKDKKKVIVDEKGIERIGDRMVEYVEPAEKVISDKSIVPQITKGR